MNRKSPRLQAIQNIVEQIEEMEIDESSNEVDPDIRIVLFSEWVHELDLIERFLEWQFEWDFKVLRFDGTRSPEEREDVRRRFQHKKERSILLAIVGVGGQGITLTTCHHVVLIQFLWTLAEERQAIARCQWQCRAQKVHVWRQHVRILRIIMIVDHNNKKGTFIDPMAGNFSCSVCLLMAERGQ